MRPIYITILVHRRYWSSSKQASQWDAASSCEGVSDSIYIEGLSFSNALWSLAGDGSRCEGLRAQFSFAPLEYKSITWFDFMLPPTFSRHADSEIHASLHDPHKSSCLCFPSLDSLRRLDGLPFHIEKQCTSFLLNLFLYQRVSSSQNFIFGCFNLREKLWHTSFTDEERCSHPFTFCDAEGCVIISLP